MQQKKLNDNLWILTAADGHWLRRVGSDSNTPTRQASTTDPALYEELPLSALPAYTKAEYDARVAELVRERYTADEEFALQRKLLAAMLTPTPISESTSGTDPAAEFAAYNAYVEHCKAEARSQLDALNS